MMMMMGVRGAGVVLRAPGAVAAATLAGRLARRSTARTLATVQSMCGVQSAVAGTGARVWWTPPAGAVRAGASLRLLHVATPTATAKDGEQGQAEPIVITPSKQDRSNETTDHKRARLLYQSRKRGIKEMDLILATYADQYLDTMTEQQLEEYDSILNDHDNEWDMFKWLTGKEELPEYLQGSGVMQHLMEFTKNPNKEQRAHMPPLRPKQQ
ncbi:hypothetical protein PTSG_05135 [Salpingoeca rosetta]|uniref:Succinate dehydrogenase assembly factor 2, mitochondrial n=1 Tax=Salpingoeca rosetta (strain ATCC 50818 / BSB-021) TaxID=946362 RepID=F2UAL6_SALR5|nr:uncharacterized protein PTSG_05135 [Salpingoeca rosetta]EGD73432.1 hypothetical protein PTSG_05135 [Salpingoeca rosetta]|eukprot:XP_004993714.1 hypothetical protein PTSG_05135 [Salpingoeca rosetta]